jgi:cell division protein FtsN
MPAPAEGPSASEEKQKRFAIQVGVFVAESGAQQLADELARAGYPARVELGQENGATVYRVVTGRYRTEYAARKAMDELRQEGFPGFLVER